MEDYVVESEMYGDLEATHPYLRGRQTDRQTDRETDRETKISFETGSLANVYKN